MKTISRSFTMFGSALVLALLWGASALAGTLLVDDQRPKPGLSECVSKSRPRLHDPILFGSRHARSKGRRQACGAMS